MAQAVKYNLGQIILPNQRIKQAGDTKPLGSASKSSTVEEFRRCPISAR